MKNIYDHRHTAEILKHIDKLSPTSQPEWEKMDVTQMLAHCSAFQDIVMGNSFPTRNWLEIIIGRFVKKVLYNDEPLPRNMSTIPIEV